jgi:hypothetical protein
MYSKTRGLKEEGEGEGRGKREEERRRAENLTSENISRCS